MALPKLNAPTYQITIPSTGVTTQYRPFLVKEQKHLMMAQESEDLNEIANTVSTEKTLSSEQPRASVIVHT